MRRIAFIATRIWLFSWLVTASFFVAAAKPGNVAVDLVSEFDSIAPGKPFWVALRMRHDKHWHTYWRNPGDAGLPTTMTWRLPAGFRAGDIEWPYPERLQLKSLASFGYQGEVLLSVLIFPPRELPAKSDLTVDVRWLECSENCIPREAKLTLSLPAARTGPTRGRHAEAFAIARQRLVQAADGLTASGRIRGEHIEVSIILPPQMPRRGELFVVAEDLVEPGVVPTLAEAEGKLIWSSRLTPNGRKEGRTVWRAVWVASPVQGRRQAFYLDIKLP